MLNKMCHPGSKHPETNSAVDSVVPNRLVKDAQCRRSGRCSHVVAWYQPLPRHRAWTWLWPLPFACFLCVLAVHMEAGAPPGTFGRVWATLAYSSACGAHTRACFCTCVFQTPPVGSPSVVPSNLVPSACAGLVPLYWAQLARLITLVALGHLIHGDEGPEPKHRRCYIINWERRRNRGNGNWDHREAGQAVVGRRPVFLIGCLRLRQFNSTLSCWF